jgi:hypothetical protein
MNVNGLARLRWTSHQSGAVAGFAPFLAAGFRGHELLMSGEGTGSLFRRPQNPLGYVKEFGIHYGRQQSHRF